MEKDMEKEEEDEAHSSCVVLWSAALHRACARRVAVSWWRAQPPALPARCAPFASSFPLLPAPPFSRSCRLSPSRS